MVSWFIFFLSVLNITHLFPLYISISPAVLKFLKGFWKLAVFSLLLTKFSIFLKSTCLFLAVFLKFIFSQKERRGFIWPEMINFLFQNPSNFYSEKKGNILQFLQNLCKITMNMNFFTRIFLYSFLLFRNTYLKEHLWVVASTYFNREASKKCENYTLQTDLRGVLISWKKYLSNSK